MRYDELLARWRAVPVPDHEPGFWEWLREDLERGSGSRTASNETCQHPEVIDLHLDRRRNGRSPHTRARVTIGAAAAAVALLTMAVGVRTYGSTDQNGLASGTIERTDIAEDAVAEPAESAASEAAMAAPGRFVGVAGRVLAVDPSGRLLFVSVPRPGVSGCRGEAQQEIRWVRPDGSSPSMTALPVDASESVKVAFGSEGRVAFAPVCEGRGNQVVTAVIADDGTLVDINVLTIKDLDLDVPVDRIDALAWVGAMIIASTTTMRERADHHHVVKFPADPSEMEDVGTGERIALGASPDGRLIAVAADGRVEVDGEAIGRIEPAPVEADIAGSLVLAAGPGGVVSFDLRSGTTSRLAPSGSNPQMTASGMGFFVLDGELHAVAPAAPGDASTPIASLGSHDRYVATPDGGTVYISRPRGSDGAHFVEEIRLEP